MPQGKEVSKAAMMFSTIWIITMPIISNTFQWRLTVDEIIKIGLSIVVIWSPIYLSVWLDKFTKRGNKN